MAHSNEIMNNASKKQKRLSELGLFYSAAIWGSTFFIVKDALRNVDPIILVSYRFLLAAIFAGMFCLITKKSLMKNLVHGSLLGFLLWLLFVSQTIGLSLTAASNSGFITGLFIVFLPVFAFILSKKKVLFLEVVGIVLSLLGLWILTGGLADINLGDLLTLIAAMTYAIHILLVSSYLQKGDNAFVLGFQQFLVSGIISLIFGAALGLPFTVKEVETVPIILFLALLPSFSAFTIQNLAQKIVEPVRVSLVLAFEPLFAALFAWTLGNEVVNFHRLTGGLFIFLGLVISGISNKSPSLRILLKSKESK